MSTSTSLPLNLLIDKERNRVVFAESDKDLIDILFSFLTLPMGTIVRLLSKKSSLGCLDRLYQSVEKIDEDYLHSEACKTMLLRPRSASGIQCEGLAINIDDSEHRVYYRCPSPSWSSSNPCAVSSVPDARCRCGEHCRVPILKSNAVDGSDGVFVKGVTSFMISDDLRVMPVSLGGSLALLNRMGIVDGNVLEKRTVYLGKEKILVLLKRSLVSKMPLTDVFLQELDLDMIDVEEKSVTTDVIQARVNNQRTADDSKRINLKLYLSKESDEVVYAEAGGDLVDLLFSFLTIPLGSIIKLLGKHSSMGCIDNLYESVELLSSGGDYMKSEECRDMLLVPKLAPYFGCSYQLLRIEEDFPQAIKMRGCKSCSAPRNGGCCFHGRYFGTYHEMSPKRQNSGFGTGECYAKGMMKFMVTDKMEVMRLSPISGVHIINKLMVPLGSLVEAEASLGEAEALNLLRTCLISNTVLSDVFSPYLLTLLEQNWCGRFPSKSDRF